VSLQRKDIMKILMVACLLIISELPAHAQAMDIEHAILDDPVLKEKYGCPCTSINGTEFSSLPRPDVSLRRLIDNAEDGDIVEIPYGYYELNSTLSVTRNVTIVGEGLVIVDAKRNFRILNIGKSNVNVLIRNIAFVNGKGGNGGAIDNNAKNLTLVGCALSSNIANNGSAIYSRSGELYLKDCQMKDNFAEDSGGITVLADNVSLVGCTFVNNTALENGGCIYSNAFATGGSMSSISHLNATRCAFIENDAALKGAAVYSDGNHINIESCDILRNNGTSTVALLHGALAIENCRISENSGPYNLRYGAFGSGIELNNCSAIIENCSIEGNKAIYLANDGYGGSAAGILLWDSDVTMNDTIVRRNEAFSEGGILVDGGSTLVMNRGIVSWNIARYAIQNGELYNGNASGMSIWPGGKVTLNGVTFEDNHADHWGGGIANFGLLTLVGTNGFLDNTADIGGAIYNAGQITIDGISNFMNNKAKAKGGAIYNEGAVSLENATFSDNQANAGAAIYNLGTLAYKSSLFNRNHAKSGTIWSQGIMILDENPRS
jgi:predicted outer membrane repeat protein